MNYLQYSEFHNKSKEYFDQIENGQSFIITRRGKPIAKILPLNDTQKVVSKKVQKDSGWKRKFKKVINRGEPSHITVVKTRNEERW